MARKPPRNIACINRTCRCCIDFDAAALSRDAEIEALERLEADRERRRAAAYAATVEEIRQSLS